MKKVLSGIFTLIVLFACLQTGLSQHARVDQSASPKSFTKAAPAIPELLQSLPNITSPRKKADVLYELANAYLSSFKIDSSLYYAEEFRKIANKNNYTQDIGKYHLVTAGAYFLRNRTQDLTNHLDTAIRIFEAAHNDLYLGLCYRLKGRQLGQANDNVGAQQYYRQSIALIRKSGDQNHLQRAVHDFGRNFYFSFELDSAALYLTQALKIAEQMDNQPRVFSSAASLGAVYLLANELEQATKTLKYALEKYPPDADKIQLRAVLANYSEACILTDRFTEAERALKEHDKINALLKDVTGQLNDKKLRGFLLYRQGRNKEALKSLQEAYSLKEKLGKNDFDVITIALYLGMCELKEGMSREAIAHFHHALQLSDKYNFVATAMDANMLLAQSFKQVNNTDSAYFYYLAYASIKDSVFQIERDKTILQLSATYNAEKKEYLIKELQKEKALQDKTIQAQQLLSDQRRQQLALVTQQSEVDRLRASEQLLALEGKNREVLQKQKELEAAQKESKLLQAVAAKESQNKKLLVAIIVAGLFTGFYGIYRYRQIEKIRKQLALSLVHLKQAQQQLIEAEKQNEAQDIRQRISRDIHDEVGATLSGVVLFSELAMQKIDKQNRAAGECLDHIYSNSKDMLEKMSDIVWAINPKNDSFERIIFKLKTYTMELCSGKGINLHFDIDESLFQYSPSMQTRKNIYLLLKEALNNAVKYSMARNISLSMKRNADLLSIGVIDDGKGFALDDIAGGNGIGNMQARAKALGSELLISSAPGKGTHIVVEFEFHPNEVLAALAV